MGKTVNWSEEFVNTMYHRIDIYHPHQLDLEEIAARNGLSVLYKPTGPMNLGDVIVLDERVSEAQQWQDFGHELCHALWHDTSSYAVPGIYRHYQEMQADNFARYVCMPGFMLDALDIPSHFAEAVWLMQEVFGVDRRFASDRLSQYLRNLYAR